MSGAPSTSWTLPPGPPLTEAQRALVAEVFPLARVVARHFAADSERARRYVDDLEGVAYEGFIWAAQKYDPVRGGVWKSYAYGGALMRCRTWFRAMALRDIREPDLVLRPDDEDELTRLDVTPDPGPAVDELVLQRQVLGLVERLPERERIAVRRYLDDMTLEEVGAAHGVVREAVRRWELSGLQRLREALGASPRTKRPRKAPAPLNAEVHLWTLLTGDTPLTAMELAKVTGYSRQTVDVKLRALGAVRTDEGPGRAARWHLPRVAA